MLMEGVSHGNGMCMLDKVEAFVILPENPTTEESIYDFKKARFHTLRKA